MLYIEPKDKAELVVLLHRLNYLKIKDQYGNNY